MVAKRRPYSRCIDYNNQFSFQNLFRYLSLYVMAPVRFGIERKLRYDVFSKLLHLPISWFIKQNKGDIISRASNDISEIQWSVLQSIETAVRSPISIIGSLLVMLYIAQANSIHIYSDRVCCNHNWRYCKDIKINI